MEAVISDLSEDDVAHLQAKRKWVLGHADDVSRVRTVEGKLWLVDTIIQQRWISADETVKLQALGVVLGDAVAQEMQLEWRMVEDEHGRDPALVVPNTTIRLFPMTMISKRIEGGEEVDVLDLFGRLCGQVKTLVRELRGK